MVFHVRIQASCAEWRIIGAVVHRMPIQDLLRFVLGLCQVDLWRIQALVKKKPNKPRHDNPYQPPCFDDFP